MAALVVIGGVVGMFALLALSALWKGYVLTVLWGWFVVPTFGLPALALVPAMGLSLVVSFLTYQHNATTQSKGTGEATAHAALMPLFVLGIGWAVHQFM